MLQINGRLKHKSLIKEGTSQYGKWQVMQFTIEKTRMGEKILIAFTAKGKWADFINNAPLKERIQIYFYPNCFLSTKTNRFYTELQVERVEKYVAKQKYNYAIEGESYNQQDINKEIKTDLQLDFKQDDSNK